METLGEQSKTSRDMTVIETIQWILVERVWLWFNVTPLFNVDPLDGTY